MALVSTDNRHYGAIAAAIRSKLGVADPYKPSEMAAAIARIPVGGGGISGNAFVTFDFTSCAGLSWSGSASEHTN